MEKFNILDLSSVSFEDRYDLPDVSGIYFVCQYDEVLYIGKSIDIKKRWYSHHKQKEIELLSNIAIRWIERPLEELDEQEKSYIQLFNPPLNYSQKWIIPKPMVISPIYPTWIWVGLIAGAILISWGQALFAGQNLDGEVTGSLIIRIMLLIGGLLMAFTGGFYQGTNKYYQYLISKTEISDHGY